MKEYFKATGRGVVISDIVRFYPTGCLKTFTFIYFFVKHFYFFYPRPLFATDGGYKELSTPPPVAFNFPVIYLKQNQAYNMESIPFATRYFASVTSLLVILLETSIKATVNKLFNLSNAAGLSVTPLFNKSIHNALLFI